MSLDENAPARASSTISEWPRVLVDEGRLKAGLSELVRGTVEETLNALLEQEADELRGATAKRGNQRT